METTERSRAAYHHGNLRAALLERAEQMLEFVGPHELSLRELARSVGVSHGAPRRHFADRQALLDALAETGFERLGQELDAAAARAGLPWPGDEHAEAAEGREGAGYMEPDAAEFVRRLSLFAHTWVEFALRHAPLLELMFAARSGPGAARQRAAAERALGPSYRFLRTARTADGRGGARTAVLAALQGLAVLIGSGLASDRPATELIETTVEMLAHGLLPR